MNLKELMMQYLREEGYCPKEDEYSIDFKCEGLGFAFLYDEDDDQFFRLMMPNIFEVTDENRDEVLRALNETNNRVKVAKLYTPIPTSVWAAFEVLVDSTPVLDDIVPRALATLRGARMAFYEAIQNG